MPGCSIPSVFTSVPTAAAASPASGRFCSTVGPLAISAQHVRGVCYRRFRDGRRRRLLPAGAKTGGLRPHLSERRSHGGAGRIAWFRRFPRAIETASLWRNINPSRSPPWRASSTPRRRATSFSSASPNWTSKKLDNPILYSARAQFPDLPALGCEVKGLNDFPHDQWPDNIPLLYYSYHIMVGLGTIFIAVSMAAAFSLIEGSLYGSRWLLWILMLSFPFPYIANTAGWMTAEFGRQPWLVYGLMRTPEGFSHSVRRQRPVYAARIHGNVYGAFHPLSVFSSWARPRITRVTTN